MTARELLTDLAGLGITLVAHGDRLRFAPRSAVTPELLARIVQHKAELLQLLAPEPVDAEGASDAEPAGPEPPADLIRCPWCGGTDLADDQTGAWCRRCARLGWHYTATGALRADCIPRDAPPTPKPRRLVRRRGPAPVDWPWALADFTLLLQPDDLPPAPFRVNAWTIVENPDRFLHSLQADVRRGPAGPRARYGALQRDLRALRQLLDRAVNRQEPPESPTTSAGPGSRPGNTSGGRRRYKGTQRPSSHGAGRKRITDYG